MEKEDMIKVMVTGLAVLVIAAPLLIGTMTALTEDGVTHTYTVETEDTYDAETGELISTQPPKARDFVEYAKSKGDSWTFSIGYTSHSYTIYKNGKIVEQVTDEYNVGGGYYSILWYIHSDGFGQVFPYSAPIYLTSEKVNSLSMVNLVFSYSKGTTEITGYDHDQSVVYEQSVKMEKLWYGNVHGNYIIGPNSNVQYINNDDLYWVLDNGIFIHGDTVEIWNNNVKYTGDVEYTYTESDDPNVKTLSRMDYSVRYYSSYAENWFDITGYQEGTFKDIITPAELTYKEPYVKGNMAAMVAIIPAIVLLGIGMYLFKRLSDSE